MEQERKRDKWAVFVHSQRWKVTEEQWRQRPTSGRHRGQKQTTNTNMLLGKTHNGIEKKGPTFVAKTRVVL